MEVIQRNHTHTHTKPKPKPTNQPNKKTLMMEKDYDTLLGVELLDVNSSFEE